MKTPFLLVSVAFAVSLLPATLIAEEGRGAKIQALIDAHQQKLAAFSEKLQAAPREEQGKIYQNEYPDPTAGVVAITEIVKANPTDEASLGGIVWILSNSRGASADPAIFTVLEEHYLDDEKLVDAIASLMRNPSPETRAFLKTASEKSENKTVRGMAIYALAIGIERDTSKSEEYTALIEQLVEDYPDLEFRGRSIAKSAEGKLFAAKHLGIGKPAPEILGQDVDGKQMKLSDYRGKVVVIDFWGDW